MHLKESPQGTLVYCTEDNSFLKKRAKLCLKLKFGDHKRNRLSQDVLCNVWSIGGKLAFAG